MGQKAVASPPKQLAKGGGVVRTMDMQVATDEAVSPERLEVLAKGHGGLEIPEGPDCLVQDFEPEGMSGEECRSSTRRA